FFAERNHTGCLSVLDEFSETLLMDRQVPLPGALTVKSVRSAIKILPITAPQIFVTPLRPLKPLERGELGPAAGKISRSLTPRTSSYLVILLGLCTMCRTFQPT